jgi:hypothetical protein
MLNIRQAAFFLAACRALLKFQNWAFQFQGAIVQDKFWLPNRLRLLNEHLVVHQILH